MESRKFTDFTGVVSTPRLILATVLGSSAILVLSSLSHSTVVGYGYGALLFVLISWPLTPRIVRSVRWTDVTLAQSLLLLVASVAMGSIGDRILGFNPQKTGLNRFDWPMAKHMLWQFPLVLPVENLLLLGMMVALWQVLRPFRPLQRMGAIVVAALGFGLWHVPFWGVWTIVPIATTVLPWILYIVATGDLVVPVVTHVLMDSLAMLTNFAPPRSPWAHYAVIGLVLVLLVAETLRSVYLDAVRARGG